MKKPVSVSSSLMLLLAFAAAVCWPRPAHAYVDPGTGSFVLQGIIAAIVGAGFALKMFWKRIVGAITGRKPEADEDDE